MIFQRFSKAVAAVCLFSSVLCLADQERGPKPTDPVTTAAFERLYNLDYDRAIQLFTQVEKKEPSDPMAVNHLLTAVLFKELYRIGALTTGDYANDSFLSVTHQAPDPGVKAQIQQLVDKAQGLEDERLKANPNDVAALYARGNTKAQYSTYLGLIEHAWLSALRNAVGARRDHERVLELDPNFTEAKLIVGAHQYVVGSLPWAVRAAGSVAGLGGDKRRGLQLLQEAASGGGESGVDAKILLALFLRREKRYPEAMTLVRELEGRYPGNVLLALEEGNLLRSEGRGQEAAEVYRGIWQRGQAGRYPGLHYEIAALALGDLLRSQKDYTGAAAAYDQVSQVSHPDPEFLQKANLGAGEMYDMLQKRDLALQKYQTVIAENSSTPPADVARKRMKEAYRPD